MERSNQKERKTITPELLEQYKTQSTTINKSFISYYKELIPFTNQSDMESFFSSNTIDLPTTFRISKINPYCDSVEEELSKILIKHNITSRIKRYSFNFLNNIFEITLNKTLQSDIAIKELLRRENETGVLRQELVAMIPVNLVDINESDIILDLCASPGNKTVQALEIMEEKARNNGILPTGVIIANDVDTKRADNMSHFFKSQYPSNVIVSNTNGITFPIIKDEEYRPNIVICDVPCSGDGTLRKNKGLRKRWTVNYAFQNHDIQIKLLENAVKLCRKGGRIVYSTCSINPIENEAVINHVLNRYKGVIEIENVSERLNKFNIKFREGLVKWKVLVEEKDNTYKWVNSWNEVPETKRGWIRESMFDEIYTKNNYGNKVYFRDPLNLRRCVRWYSHDNNSGNFFIAVIKKLENGNDNNNWNKENQENLQHPGVVEDPELNGKTIGQDLEDFLNEFDINSDEEKNKCQDLKQPKEEHTNETTNQITKTSIQNTIEPPLTTTDTLIFHKYVNVKDFTLSYENLNWIYKFDSDAITKFLYCNRETAKKIFLFSDKLVKMWYYFTWMNLNILRSGMTVFKRDRQDIKSNYRITHYGAIQWERYLTGQKVELKQPKLIRQIFESEEYSVVYKDIEKCDMDWIDKIDFGGCVLIYDAYVICCRKGKNTIALMVPKMWIPGIKKYFLEFCNSL